MFGAVVNEISYLCRQICHDLCVVVRQIALALGRKLNTTSKCGYCLLTILFSRAQTALATWSSWL